MLSQNDRKRIQSLQSKKKYREKYELFTAEGEQLVADFLKQFKQGGIKIQKIYATSEWNDSYRTIAQKLNIPVQDVNDKELRKISSLHTPNQVLAELAVPEEQFRPQRLVGQLTIALDNVQDPGNMGNIIRIADWFGVSEIICTHTVDAFNPKVVQATMGSISRVRIHDVSLTEVFRHVNLPIYGTTLEGENIHQASLPDEGIIVFGNEARGISQEVRQQLSAELRIPRYGPPDSLNVAASAAIVLDNFRQQSDIAPKL